MENYTIDLAELARAEEGARGIGSTIEESGIQRKEQGSEARVESQPKETAYVNDTSEDEESRLMDGYTIDLGGLGDKPSSVLVEDRPQNGEEIPSDDEGPQDFTLNMEKWMRGNQAWNKRQQVDVLSEESVSERDAKDAIPDAQNENIIEEESVFEPLVASTPGRRDIIERNNENGSRLQAPPLSRLNTEKLQDQAAEEVFERISALQAEVERMRLEDAKRQKVHQDLKRENEQLRYANEDMHYRVTEKEQNLPQDFATTKSSSPMSGSNSAAQEVVINKGEADSNNRKADAKIEELERHLQISSQEVQTLQEDLASKQKASNLALNILHNELEEERTVISTLRANSERLENETAALHETLAQKDEVIHSMLDDAVVARTDFDHAQEQSRESRRILETVEDENDRLIQENAKQAQDIKEIDDLLKTKATELQAAHTTIVKLRDAPNSVQPTPLAPANDGYDTHKAALAEICQQHESALSYISSQHAKEMDKLRSLLKKASASMRKRELQSSRTHNYEPIDLQQIASIKPQMSTEPEQRENALEPKLRSAIRVLSEKLESAKAAITKANTEAQAAQQRAEEIQQANETINAELEMRFEEAIEAREREWTKRVSLLLRERDKMGHVLLHGWGKEEMGHVEKGQRQAYKYRYVKGRF